MRHRLFDSISWIIDGPHLSSHCRYLCVQMCKRKRARKKSQRFLSAPIALSFLPIDRNWQTEWHFFPPFFYHFRHRTKMFVCHRTIWKSRPSILFYYYFCFALVVTVVVISACVIHKFIIFPLFQMQNGTNGMSFIVGRHHTAANKTTSWRFLSQTSVFVLFTIMCFFKYIFGRYLCAHFSCSSASIWPCACAWQRALWHKFVYISCSRLLFAGRSLMSIV